MNSHTRTHCFKYTSIQEATSIHHQEYMLSKLSCCTYFVRFEFATGAAFVVRQERFDALRHCCATFQNLAAMGDSRI